MQTDSQTDRQTNCQTDRQTNRQIKKQRKCLNFWSDKLNIALSNTMLFFWKFFCWKNDCKYTRKSNSALTKIVKQNFVSKITNNWKNVIRGGFHKLFCPLRWTFTSPKSFSKVGRRCRAQMDRAISMKNAVVRRWFF